MDLESQRRALHRLHAPEPQSQHERGLGEIRAAVRELLVAAWVPRGVLRRGTKQQQYLLKLSGGLLVRGTTPTFNADLSNALFLGAGLATRYPFSRHVAAVGTIEDDVAFIPSQTIDTTNVGGGVQHNLGLFVVVQWRP